MAKGFNVRFICPAGQFYKAKDEWQQIMAHAATTAVRQVGINARDAARDIIATAGFGPSWYKSIVSSMHPKRGDVLNPWAWVHSTINFSDVFETGKTISPKAAKYIWIPQPWVPKYPGTGTVGEPLRQMNPKKYVQLIGRLQFVHPPGKSPMLLGAVSGKISASQTAQLPKKGFGFQLGFTGRQKRRTIQWVPMFIGVPSVTIRKRFDVMPAVQREAARLDEEYIKNITEFKAPI